MRIAWMWEGLNSQFSCPAASHFHRRGRGYRFFGRRGQLVKCCRITLAVNLAPKRRAQGMSSPVDPAGRTWSPLRFLAPQLPIFSGGEGYRSFGCRGRALYSTMSSNVAAAIPTARCTKMIFPESCEVSVIVKKTKPGAPESERLSEQVPAAKSAAVPAHNSRLVPGVWFSNESFKIVTAVVVTGAPVTRYLPLVPTVPVMVVAPKAFPAEAATRPEPTIRSPTAARTLATGPAFLRILMC